MAEQQVERPGTKATTAQFVAALQAYVANEDRAALAALRRGLGKPPGTVAEMYPYVVPHLPPGFSEWQENAAYLVAALFGSYPSERPATEAPNLGASFALLRQKVDGDGPERRFVALLGASAEELPNHLQHAIALLRAHEVPVKWARLLDDVVGWEGESRVQRAWARAFWRHQIAPAASPNDARAAAQ